MNIKQALKKKNKLVAKINQEFQKLNTYNSVEVGTERSYDALVSLNEYINLEEELISLKTKIHLANARMYDKIFRLSELKSIVKTLKSMNCTEGKQTGFRYQNTEPIVYTSQINTVTRDKMVEKYEEEIEKIQDELDYYNQVTEI